MEYSLFLPVRAGSQRVTHKNTRPFAGFDRGLVEVKLSQMCQLSDKVEIVLSTNDTHAIETANSEEFSRKVTIDRRPDYLCSSIVPLAELISYVANVCQNDWIIWSHVTSPLLDGAALESAIFAFEEGRSEGHDSLIGVSHFQKYLWDPLTGSSVNYDHESNPWPPTQDLPVWYEVNSSVFIANRQHYQAGDRIGQKPVFWKTPYPADIDIDSEEDFRIAEEIFRQYHQ